MAETVREWPSNARDHRKDSVSRFDKYLDGQIWCLKDKIDYTISLYSLRSMLSVRSRSLGKRISTHYNSETKLLYVQAIARKKERR